MNLDDVEKMREIDRQGMIEQIIHLPEQLQSAWAHGLRQDLPAWAPIRRVIISAAGSSAIGAEMAAVLLAAECPVPIIVHRDFGLPAWAHGPETLVIASSFSGETEETFSALTRAGETGCRVLAITTGGRLAEACRQTGTPAWVFQFDGLPRSAIGFSFGMLLAALHRMGLARDYSEGIAQAVTAMQEQALRLVPDVPVSRNPAKRAAGQAVGRWVSVLASDSLVPVARRWKSQISETSKAWSQFEALPAAGHETLPGLYNPEEIQPRMMALFLRAPSDHSRNRLRSDLTRQMFMMAGLNTDFYDAPGDTPLAQMWTALHFGDFLSYYLAVAYQVDPAVDEVGAAFHQALAG